MSAVIFRKVQGADLEQVLNLNQKFVPKVGEIDLQWLKKYLKLAEHFEVAEIQGEIVGFLIAMLPETDYASENFQWFKKNLQNFIYVDRIAVSDAVQGKGLGKEFYTRLSAKYRNQVANIACEVNLRPENPQSLFFHRNFGFQELAQQETKKATIRVSLLAKKI